MIEELKNATPEEERRLAALRSFFVNHPDMESADGDPPTSVHVYCYRDWWGGIRISEISLVWKTQSGVGGASWMASDLDSFPVIYAAERYLLDCLLPVSDGYDAEQEARRGLLYWLMEPQDYNELPDWEERDTNPLAEVTA